jgi:predicted dehydrogenase
MENRRDFIKTVAMAAAAASTSRTVLGQNDKVRMAVIGTGTRGSMVNRFFRSHADCEFVAACDVRKTRLDAVIKEIGGKVDGYSDYRRILDRKDIDAVLVTTPDHWHGPIVAQACAAGKDAYVEKPMTHTIEDAVMAVEAAKKYKRIVQLGVQQRSGAHFLECVKMIQDGVIGKVSHCVLNQPGSYGGVVQPTAPVPEDLDWEMFQGSAPRKPFSPS